LDNQITSLSQTLSGGTVLSAGFSYDADGRRYQANLPNGVFIAYNYDQDSRLTSVNYSANGSSLGNLSYAYDADGRKTSFGGSLAAVTAPTPFAATYSTNNHMLTFNGSSTGLATDADGHMTSDPSSNQTYTWKDGLFFKAKGSGSNSVELGYDSLGRRGREALLTSKTPPEFKSPNNICPNPCIAFTPEYDIDYLYSGTTPVQQQNYTTCFTALSSSSCNEISKDFEENMLVLPDSGEVLARTDHNGNTVVPLLDGLGSLVGLVNSGGSIATSYQYTPFGKPTQSGSSNSYPYLFAGREWSDPLNLMQLYYNEARQYSPGLHRFISADPLGVAGSGANLYAYVGDDPINSTDPTGLFQIGLILGFDLSLEGAAEFSAASFFEFAGSYSTADYDPPEHPVKTLKPSAPTAGANAAQHKPKCTADKKAFVDANKASAAVIANKLNVPAANILGLSFEESHNPRGGLTPIAQDCHNFFGIHRGGAFSNGACPGHRIVSAFPASNGYLLSGESFAQKYGNAVKGITDPSAFASHIPRSFNSRVAPGGNPDFDSLIAGTIIGIKPCLQ
jgi:RHS repeat-associated protein